jgi:hypothetical protein
MVESNQGHEGDRVDPKAGDDKSIHSWRASAEVARFSVEFLSRIPLVDVTDGRIVGSRAMAAPSVAQAGQQLYRAPRFPSDSSSVSRCQGKDVSTNDAFAKPTNAKAIRSAGTLGSAVDQPSDPPLISSFAGVDKFELLQ